MRYTRSFVAGTSLVLGFISLAIIVYFLSVGSCPSGSFRCDNGTKCIPQRHMCDHHSDCEDNRDEKSEECGETYGSKEMLHNILSLVLNKQNQSQVNDSLSCIDEEVPPWCACVQKYQLHCSDGRLRDVPTVNNVLKLLLPNNSIKLRGDSFDGYDLQLINLEWNSLAELPDGVFKNQKNLTKLYLMNNKLKVISSAALTGLKSLNWLFLQHNQLTDITVDGLEDLQWLDLSYNNLTSIRPFPELPSIYELFLANNHLTQIEKNTFDNVPSLQNLRLCFNKIHAIEAHAFDRLVNLRELDLTGNELKTLPPGLLHPLDLLSQLFIGYNPFDRVEADFLKPSSAIMSMRLEDIDIGVIDFDIFKNIKSLKNIYFKKFYYCSMLPTIKKCKPNSDGISSLSDLVHRDALRVTTWIVAGLTLSCNFLVLWGRFSSRDENRSLSLLIRNLAVADMLMGIYLTVIAIQDLKYRGTYQEHSHEWTKSWSCTLIGALAMTSSEVSLLILAFMSVERFLLIVDPLGGHPRLTPRIARLIMAALWFTGITLAILPIIYWSNSTRFYGTYSGMCFPLHLSEKFPLGWQYSAFIFLGINMTGLLVIATVYCAMFVSILRTRKAVTTTADCEFAIRFFFIVLTNAACWAPIVCVKILTFFDVEISADIYAWLVVFVVPLNSSMNPLLYTFTTPKYRDQLLSFSWRFSANRSSNNDTETSRTSSSKNVTCSVVGLPKSFASETYVSSLNGQCNQLDCKL